MIIRLQCCPCFNKDKLFLHSWLPDNNRPWKHQDFPLHWLSTHQWRTDDLVCCISGSIKKKRWRQQGTIGESSLLDESFHSCGNYGRFLSLSTRWSIQGCIDNEDRGFFKILCISLFWRCPLHVRILMLPSLGLAKQPTQLGTKSLGDFSIEKTEFC